MESYKRRRGAGLVVALAFLFTLPAAAQPDTVPPLAPPETPAPAAPAVPKAWLAAFDAGPLTASTPEELSSYAGVRLTVIGEPRSRLRLGGQLRADRTSNGAAWTLEEFRLFKSAEALAFGTYRIGETPISIGAAGSLSWSIESGIKSLRDPNLWSFGGIACVERFAWWPNGGLACLGAGRWSGKDGLRVSVTQPLKGEAVLLVVDTDIPFRKLPEFARALPGALAGAPLTGPPTPDQIAGIAQRLPIAVKVGLLVRLKGLEF